LFLEQDFGAEIREADPGGFGGRAPQESHQDRIIYDMQLFDAMYAKFLAEGVWGRVFV
jgi:hypothetical protein